MKVGDEAGLGAINTPYASLGVVKDEKGLSLRCYDQNTNREVLKPLAISKIVWLRLWGDYDKSQLQYSYSLDGILLFSFMLFLSYAAKLDKYPLSCTFFLD